MSGAVTEGVLESIHDLPAVIDREAFVRECRAGRASHRVPAWRENPESWAMQGLSGGGLEPTVRSVRALRPAWGPVAMR